MYKKILIIIIVVIAGIAIFQAFNKNSDDTKIQETNTANSDIKITPVSHATMVLDWNGQIVYTDPVGGAQVFSGQPSPNLILLTDIHGDHLNAETLLSVAKAETVIIAPQAVAGQLPQGLAGTVVVLKNGDTTNQKGFSVQAIPMYNVPETETAPHTKGRGNGYVIEASGKRVYVSGDTGNTPEMRALQNIDLAFVSMNLPYTMGVEDATQAVLGFKPKRIIPYHYRGTDGLSDINKFKELVNKGNPDIQVDLMNFYPSN